MHIDVTTRTFETDVIARSHETVVVVDFWADWCGPCRVLGPILERLADESGGRWVLAKVDTTANPDLAQRYGIQGIPAVKAFKDGVVVDEFVGALPQHAVRAWLDKVVPSPADDLAAEADAAMAAGDRARAEALYLEALEHRADHAHALLGLAELALPDGDRVRELLRRLPDPLEPTQAARRARLRLAIEAGGEGPERLAAALRDDPDDLDTRWRLAHALAAAERYEEALGHLLEIVRRDRAYRDDGARKAMLEIFDAIGPRSPLADTWRDRLARVLY